MFRFLYLAIASFAIVFLSIAASGIFSTVTPVFKMALYSMPLNVCSFMVLVAMVVELLILRSRAGAARWMALLATVLLCAGFWLGGLMGFSMRTVITEGQTVTLPGEAAFGLGGYRAKYSRPPVMSIRLRELLPQFNATGDRLDGLEARLLVSKYGAPFAATSVKRGPLSNPFGVSISISDFGYSPRFELYDNRGNVLDSSFVYLKLFPPGLEDQFRLLSPLTYYLRYDPWGEGGPYFNVRVARNRDISFNGQVALGERFNYENAAMAFPEIRRWTVLEVSANPGAPLLWAGFIVALTSLALMLRNRRAEQTS